MVFTLAALGLADLPPFGTFLGKGWITDSADSAVNHGVAGAPGRPRAGPAARPESLQVTRQGGCRRSLMALN